MIYNNSNDPIYIKKISLKIWCLRDEVEAIVRSKISVNGDEITVEDFHQMAEKYSGQAAKPLKLIQGGEATPAPAPEAAEAQAKSESEAQDAAEETAVAAEQAPEAANPAPVPQAASDEMHISTRRPELTPDKIFSGRTLLSEVGMDRIHFFSNQKFLEGQSIVMEFEIPKRFIVNADIVYCRSYSMKSRIISANKLPFRVSARFTFLKPGERALLRDFLESIEVDMTKVQVKELPKEEKSEGGDDLGDFGDLGI
jgi:hypothetical protein